MRYSQQLFKIHFYSWSRIWIVHHNIHDSVQHCRPLSHARNSLTLSTVTWFWVGFLWDHPCVSYIPFLAYSQTSPQSPLQVHPQPRFRLTFLDGFAHHRQLRSVSWAFRFPTGHSHTDFSQALWTQYSQTENVSFYRNLLMTLSWPMAPPCSQLQIGNLGIILPIYNSVPSPQPIPI